MTEIEQLAASAKQAGQILAGLGTRTKDTALGLMSEMLLQEKEAVMEANRKDLAFAREKGISGAMLKRLELTDAKIEQMARGIMQIAALPDPVGEVIKGYRRPNGLLVQKLRVPLGVIGIIYESRPNVTADVAALCIKSGNACILRGGSEAINSNLKIAGIICEACRKAGIPDNAVNIVRTTDRAAVTELLKQKRYLDCIIPRGGKGLIRFCIENSDVPVIEHGDGNCHTYVDRDADQDMALKVVYNAKVQNPSVCNATECLLVHEDIAAAFLPRAAEKLAGAGVELRGCPGTLALLPGIKEAREEDWQTEYNDLILSVKIVGSIEEAVEHIRRYGSGHSESIISDSAKAIEYFQSSCDAAAIFVNCSTRFNDGFELGMGAEMGISTQKLHARGPMGLSEITTFKYVVTGNGQCRG
ncbi:MAG: glutamate-5-semialdehyde dehydrogenase [Abditibacteriota bacterium]|nr:glutamate-5-semialdehyde dehydrogenase [Abditibacteriota bacterium]